MKEDVEVVAVDGLFFAIRAELFKKMRFDDENFDKYHFYDIDISMQVRRSNRLIVTGDILLKHLSAGNNDSSWVESGKRFLAKYKEELPVSCTTAVPDFSKSQRSTTTTIFAGRYRNRLFVEFFHYE